MKKTILILSIAAVTLGGYLLYPAKADSKNSSQTYEYATIRWSGRENTHLIRPNGEAEMLGPLFANVPRRRDKSERVDDRVLCLNIAVNALAKEGYEVAAMTSDEVMMKRPTAR
ncbi:MAG: hypothetical protein WCO56_20415 [Verrucomicrobiota bacterium]